jgi:hypothetical protein
VEPVEPVEPVETMEEAMARTKAEAEAGRPVEAPDSERSIVDEVMEATKAEAATDEV